MFDLSGVNARKEFDLLPDGKYVCHCTEAKMQDTKSGTGMMIKLTFTIAVGHHEGRKIFTNLNVQNKSAKATEIGLQQLKSLLECSGYKDPNKLENVSDLEGLRVGVKTKIKKDEQFGDRVEISFFFKPDGAPNAPAAEYKPNSDILF